MMLKKEPLISIVMTAYNEGNHIAEAIDSVLNQTYKNIEFIIVNDGSIDNTEQIILSYLDPRIVYVKNETNLKLIASLNKGMAIAKGEYIARMDSDDICLPERLEKQLRFMEAHNEIGISGAQLIIFGSQDSTMNYPVTHDDIKLRLLITSCFPNNLVIFRKSLVEQYGLKYPEGYLHAEDYKFWTEWVFVTQGYNLEDYLVKYRFHANSVSHKFKQVQRETRNRVRVEYLIRLFSLSPDQEYLANDFYGHHYPKRIKAIKAVLAKNQEQRVFDDQKLFDTICYLNYLDGLERVEVDNFFFLKYLNILTLSVSKNFRFYTYIIKHTIKSQLGLLKN